MNFMQVLSPYSAPTPLMKYAFVCLSAGSAGSDRADGLMSGKLRVAPPWWWQALLLLFCLNTNNLLYTASAQAHRATESYATWLLARIESCEGYEPGMEIAIVGRSADQIRSDIPVLPPGGPLQRSPGHGVLP